MKRVFCILIAILLLVSVLSGCTAAQGDSPSAATDVISTAASETNPQDGGLHIYCFAAGKADAFLLYTDSSAVLIDTGESGFGKTIVEKCEELGIDRLDCLIVTHFDKDHVGGAKKVLAELSVTTVLQSNVPKDSSEYEKYVRQLAICGIEPITVRGDYRLTLGGVTYTVNAPQQEHYADSASNNSSLITSVEYGAKRFLFLGDAEDARLAELIAASPAHYDLVKLPHHGNQHKPLPDLIRMTTPRYAIITSSDDQPEDARTVTLLNEAGAETFLTRIAPVEIYTDGEQITAQYEE